MLMRFDPFRELDRQFDRLSQRNWGAGVMPIDAYRRGDHFYVHFDLPGVDAQSVDLEVEKNVLTVRAERSWEPAKARLTVYEGPEVRPDDMGLGRGWATVTRGGTTTNANTTPAPGAR